MKLFPNFDDVFYQADDIHKMVFFPLLTVDLETLNKNRGKVHFVSVFGNGNPELIYHNTTLFDYDNIRFEWDGERYHFKGDLSSIESIDDIPKWYDEAVQEYIQFKDEYCLLKSWQDAENSNFAIQCQRREKIDFGYYHYIRSLINYWVTKEMYLKTGHFIQGSVYLDGIYGDLDKFNPKEYERKSTIGKLSDKSATNRSNELIGKVCGYNYIQSGEDEIKLYIDRKNNQVFEKFDWS
ncbi:Uncharacterised protein [Moraxella caprae]|uniref:Uncharacterized protein n=1 Tax=Moraxella caprae TaxID=90240 RepID=A0A378QZM5_9GAMM|nr:hypothetical protein [Moraxella caprae]STZ08503.1 Uncharacterised protein [Moraxella caprae]